MMAASKITKNDTFMELKLTCTGKKFRKDRQLDLSDGRVTSDAMW